MVLAEIVAKSIPRGFKFHIKLIDTEIARRLQEQISAVNCDCDCNGFRSQSSELSLIGLASAYDEPDQRAAVSPQHVRSSYASSFMHGRWQSMLSSHHMQVCDIGGSLKTTHEVAHKKKDYEVRDPERAFGRESRSYKAAHALIEAGFTNLLHLDGGLQQWRHQGYPCQSAS